MKLEATHLDEARGPRAATAKFMYPSGSRPLEGYTVKRGVGRGGFGEVYFATSDAGKEVALKLIRRNLEVELRGVTQCLNLKHPNLIGLYDIRTDEVGDQWVIMEYVSGESLEDVIDRHPGGMPVDEVLWWMRGVCAGVAYLHDHGIVHRDLKPGNIFCDEGTVKIGDYGLAKFISCSRRSGQTESVGTVHYMAPEIANGRYGREIDTYALGVILFEMLTGRVPFEGESVGEVLMKHLTAEPDLSALEEPYRDIVRRALAKDPDVRLKSVGELLALLPGGAEAAGVPRGAGSPRLPHSSLGETRPRGGEGDSSCAAGDRRQGTANATATDEIEEPIWNAIRTGFLKLQQRWYPGETKEIQPLFRALLVLAVVAIFVFGYFGRVMSIALPLLICYGIYYAFWSSEVNARKRKQQRAQGKQAGAAAAGGNGTPAAQQTAVWDGAVGKQSPTAAERYAQNVRRRRLRPTWRDRAMLELAAKPMREKLSELLGSMILAAMFATLAAMVAPLLMGNQPVTDRIAVYLWLATVGTLGAWAILVPTKFMEGRLEDQVPMRLIMLVLGGLVGVAAWVLGDALLVGLPRAYEPIDAGWALLSHEMLRWPSPRTAGFTPTFSMYVTYFAFLFLLLRWWRQAEFTRSARLSVWTIIACMFWAWFVHLFWWFPQPTGMMAAAVIAFSTQLASPWLPPSRRRALATEMDEAVVA